MSEASESDTVDDMPVLPSNEVPFFGEFVVDLAGHTDVGRVRPNNEDQFHIVEFGRYLRTMASSLPPGEAAEELGNAGYAFAVADGVGGAASGEVASRLAISLLIECALQTPDWVLGRGDYLLAQVLERFSQRFKAVNRAVLEESRASPALRGMGTTLSVALSRGGDLLVAHVGDSRVYLLRGGKLHRLTRDHSATQPVVDPSRAAPIRYRRVLTHAIGLGDTGGEPDLYHYKLEDGDRLLLCTDGLTDMVKEDSVASELGSAAAAADACRSLVDRALERGGRDNVTAVVAIYHHPTPSGDTNELA